jgi:RimJ/RimL family protein N-acetyltransferase
MILKDKIIYGEKVFLRPVEDKDATLIVAWRNDPEIKKWMFNQEEITLDGHLKWFKSRQNRIDYMICDLNTKKPIGTLNFININNFEAEAGKMLGDKNYWGGGYAKEAFKIWLDYGFSNCNLKKIFIRTMASNISNIRLNEKLGFKELKKINCKISTGEKVKFILMEKIRGN